MVNCSAKAQEFPSKPFRKYRSAAASPFSFSKRLASSNTRGDIFRSSTLSALASSSSTVRCSSSSGSGGGTEKTGEPNEKRPSAASAISTRFRQTVHARRPPPFIEFV